jgi:hypothetical protein
MRFIDQFLNDMLEGGDNTRLLFLAKVPFADETVYVHNGIGDKVYDGNTYKGVGNMASFSTINEDGSTAAKRLNLQLKFDDPAAFNSVMNVNPLGNEAELYLAALDEDRKIQAVELLAAGDMVDYNLKKGKPYFINLAISDWFEIWAKASNAALYTNASQQIEHPNDQFFSMVETLAKGIDDTVSGKKIGAPIGGGGYNERYRLK